MECGLNPPVLVQGPLFGCCEHINLQVLHKAGNMTSWVITRFLRMTLHHLVKDTHTHTLTNVYKYPILNRHTYITLQNAFFHTDMQPSFTQLLEDANNLPQEAVLYRVFKCVTERCCQQLQLYSNCEMSVKIWYNYNEGETQKYSYHNLRQCHHRHHKPHTERSVIKQVPLW